MWRHFEIENIKDAKGRENTHVLRKSLNIH